LVGRLSIARAPLRSFNPLIGVDDGTSQDQNVLDGLWIEDCSYGWMMSSMALQTYTVRYDVLVDSFK